MKSEMGFWGYYPSMASQVRMFRCSECKDLLGITEEFIAPINGEPYAYLQCPYCGSENRIERISLERGKWIEAPSIMERAAIDVEPYQCSVCNGYICLDSSFLEQVDTNVVCPYCRSINEVDLEED